MAKIGVSFVLMALAAANTASGGGLRGAPGRDLGGFWGAALEQDASGACQILEQLRQQQQQSAGTVEVPDAVIADLEIQCPTGKMSTDIVANSHSGSAGFQLLHRDRWCSATDGKAHGGNFIFESVKDSWSNDIQSCAAHCRTTVGCTTFLFGYDTYYHHNKCAGFKSCTNPTPYGTGDPDVYQISSGGMGYMGEGWCQTIVGRPSPSLISFSHDVKSVATCNQRCMSSGDCKYASFLEWKLFGWWTVSTNCMLWKPPSGFTNAKGSEGCNLSSEGTWWIDFVKNWKNSITKTYKKM